MQMNLLPVSISLKSFEKMNSAEKKWLRRSEVVVPIMHCTLHWQPSSPELSTGLSAIPVPEQEAKLSSYHQRDVSKTFLLALRAETKGKCQGDCAGRSSALKRALGSARLVGCVKDPDPESQRFERLQCFWLDYWFQDWFPISG